MPSYNFDFINGFLRINGEIVLSKNTPANEIAARIFNTFHIKQKNKNLIFLSSTSMTG